MTANSRYQTTMLVDGDIDPRLLARTKDPLTSHDAAAKVAPKSGTVRANVLTIFREHPIPMTDERLLTIYGQEVARGRFRRASDSSLRTRRSELVNGGWLRDSGRTAPTVSGLQATLWELT